jgi:hypothetical protein
MVFTEEELRWAEAQPPEVREAIESLLQATA